MVFKSQVIPPLETIYEESGSFLSSTVHFHPQSTKYEYMNDTIHGLISARSIPSVNIQRQREYENQQKPPIEVRFRDGSKRFIQPSTTTMMIRNRRKLLDSSYEISSSSSNKIPYRPLINFNLNKKKFQSKPPLVITIITADDLHQINLSPTASSTPTETDASTPFPPQQHSSPMKLKTTKEPRRVTFEDILPTTVPNPPPSTSFSRNSHQQQVSINNRSDSIPSTKSSNASLEITLINDKNENNLSINSNLPKKPPNLTIQSNKTALTGDVTRSAFRPFLKPVRLTQQPLPVTPRVPLNVNGRPYRLQQQQQQIVSFSQQYPSITTTNSSFDINSFIQMNSSNHHQQSVPLLISSIDNSLTVPHELNLSTSSFRISPTLQWVNVVSNSIQDIPRLSTKYSAIPLHITLPTGTPTHNQKSIIKHDIALENRLLNAGLSPETVALYERILSVAGHRPLSILSPPKSSDHLKY